MRTRARLFLATALLAGLFAAHLFLGARTALADPEPTCGQLINSFSQAVSSNLCRTARGQACYVTSNVDATAKPGQSIQFNQAGSVTDLNNLSSLTTAPTTGAAYLVGGEAGNPVKIFVFGDSRLAPLGGSSGGVVMLQSGNTGLICNKFRSGAVFKTDANQSGSIVVNGVTIRLGSTALVVPGGDLLFDQDPRVERRRGVKNPNAPLCSGFDSDCDFGDKACSTSQRLVWGPYCRKDQYPYIDEGLYRVTVYGHGTVRAGATDFGATNNHFSIVEQQLNLPDTYTFCWNGRTAGGTGFETIVKPVSSDARVDHVTLEYLGRDCSQPTAIYSAADAPLPIMTVYNVEGSVQVAAAGTVRNLKPGERVRIYYSGGQPVNVSPSFSGMYVLNTTVAQTFGARTVAQPPTGTAPAEAGNPNFKADRTAINFGECTTLSWSIQGVRAVYLDNGGVAGVASQQVCPKFDQTYTLRVVPQSGNEQRYTVSVQVEGAPPINPTFFADKTTLDPGECTTLHWSVEGVKAVYLDDAGVTGNGQQKVCPKQTQTYTLRVVKRDNTEQPVGATVSVVNVTFEAAGKSVKLKLQDGNNKTYETYSPTIIRWNVQGASSVFLDGNPVAAVGQEEASLGETGASVTHTLTVIYSDGTQRVYTITLNTVPVPVI